jgi:hypothetical protein
MYENLKIGQWVIIVPKSSCFSLSTITYKGMANRTEGNRNHCCDGQFIPRNYGYGFLWEIFAIVAIQEVQ